MAAMATGLWNSGVSGRKRSFNPTMVQPIMSKSAGMGLSCSLALRDFLLHLLGNRAFYMLILNLSFSCGILIFRSCEQPILKVISQPQSSLEVDMRYQAHTIHTLFIC